METNLMDRLKLAAQTLPKSQGMAADFIVKNQREAAYMTIEQLASRVGTSTATVMRLATGLGYGGFTELIRELQEYLLSHPTLKDRFLQTDTTITEDELWVRVAEKHVQNIYATMELIDDRSLAHAVELIENAGRIYLIGIKACYQAASYLYLGLHRLLQNCELIDSPADDLAASLHAISPGDLLIGFTLPRYKSPVSKALSIARSRGAGTIAVTDGYLSPAAKEADVLLPFCYEALSFQYSPCAALVIADYLITAVSNRRPERTAEALDGVEAINAQLQEPQPR